MTDSNKVFLGILVDRSGSMDFIREDTEGGVKGFLAEQKEQPGQTEVMLAQFDDRYDTVYGPVDINDAPAYKLHPRGLTALLDAVGRFVTQVGESLAERDEDDRPGKVVVVITTDGYENASKEWSYARVSELIERQTSEWNWEFVFLGANIDAPEVAAQLGIDRNAAMTYGANAEGVENTYRSMSGLVNNVRAGGQALFTDEDRVAATGNNHDVDSNGLFQQSPNDWN